MNRANRLRLDAVARYLQDVAADDVDDVAESGSTGAWVLRRTALALGDLPRYGDDVELDDVLQRDGRSLGRAPYDLGRRRVLRRRRRSRSGCTSTGPGDPAPLGDWFFDHYGDAAAGRKVSGRLSLPHPPADAHVRPWPVRASDFDLLGHVNNAAYWFAVEDELARLAPAWRAPVSAELEHRAAIEPGDPVELRSTVDGDVLSVWLTARRRDALGGTAAPRRGAQQTTRPPVS